MLKAKILILQLSMSPAEKDKVLNIFSKMFDASVHFELMKNIIIGETEQEILTDWTRARIKDWLKDSSNYDNWIEPWTDYELLSNYIYDDLKVRVEEETLIALADECNWTIYEIENHMIFVVPNYNISKDVIIKKLREDY